MFNNDSKKREWVDMDKKSDLLQKRRTKFDELRKNGINLFPNDFTGLFATA